ncbi:MAG: DUF2497 domain-containing protein [Alphaproteobacteria bacterium]|nr:DUF2497 domain-containing protein [Alphaproteobacteria bacterium]
MAKQETEQEPSIEEILSSIRQIISDDDEEGGADSDAAPVAQEPDLDADDEEDVIDLTQKVEEEPESFASLVDDFDSLAEENESEEETKPAIEVDLRDVEPEIAPPAQERVAAPAEDVIEEPEPVVESVSARPVKSEPAPPAEMDDSILTRGAEEAAYSGFAELARKTAIEHGGITLEEIVRSELKPLLRDWLDRSLPAIIDRLVREELERVAKRALED